MGSDMPELDVMANHNIVIDPADLGFGLWPPDPWEALLHDAFAPPLDDGPADVPWDLNALLGPHGTQSRTQESAERGNAPGPPHAQVGTALLSRVLAAYPELQISVAELNESLSTYWSHVAPSFPFIHRGTFDIDAAPPELVIMMAVTGAAQRRRGGSGAPRDDRRLVRRIRARLVEDRCGLEMDVATLQAYTLCHVYDVWHGDAETLFVAQCMWPVVVAHSRKQGIGVTGRVAPEGHTAAVWAAWAKDEERRRAAYCIVTIDTQISTFWNQHPSRQLSIFAHNLSMPAPRAQWEALTAAEWLRVREPSSTTQHDHNAGRRGGRGGYLPGLHPEFQVSFVTEGYSSIVLAALAAEGPPPLRVDIDNSFAVGVILTGLVAIAWDCRTRGGMGIRFRDGTKHWRSIVLNAVVALRAAYELGVGHLPACVETRDMRDTLAVSIISILSDIPMLQVAAGATSICGASIGPKQYADGKRRLRLWATSPDAWTCLWQSARYLRETLFADWGLYTPWAVFLTTLVVWAYGSAASREDQRHFPGPTDNPQAAATALLDGIFASPTRVDHLDHGVADLVVTVAAKLDATGSLIDRTNAQLLWRLTAAKRR
ncbi:Nicotinate catabolism cluster-specific transcription factor [Vanrija pseudolonga]|uniref:Nicotinate catabolism cluster-specific transcription factor n=1 Tax=Vanrija pseudolonga TaxID=143232 RepID=A0AAF0YEH7_9TREE|nr:Nicotinate catabolism cluster-specific transcription factor [Vanrija pseudolonga]